MRLALMLLVAVTGCREVTSDRPTPSDGAPNGNLVVIGVVATDLGTLPGGASSAAFGINDLGQIVGEGTIASGATHGFILSGGSMTDLGTLPGGDFSSASGVNNHGQVVGAARAVLPSYPPGTTHAFEWEGGVMRDLGAFPPEDNIGSASGAAGINDNGLIAGSIDLAGVVWDLSGAPIFPPFPPFVRVTVPFTPALALAINNAGQAVGKLAAEERAFRWQGGVLERLASLGVPEDAAFGVNEVGEAVGVVLRTPPPLVFHAVFWPNPATIQDLGTLGGANSIAYGINDDRTIVGSSETASGNRVAFIWQSDLGMQSLGTLGGATSEARAINRSGQIVGVSETAAGARHATLWTVQLATAITIDIKPGSATNPINLGSRGLLTVAALTTPAFDAASLDPASMTLGDNAGTDTPVARRNNGSLFAALEDVDGDGDVDLVLHFSTEQLVANGDLTAATARLFLRGTSSSMGPVLGSDVVRVKP